MRVRAVLAGGSLPQEVIDIQCGTGQQILRWLGYAACTQLCQRRGEVMGCYVPQAIVKDGDVLDVDLVLSEVVADGEMLLVEYSTGPVAYMIRWEQRPKSPQLSWADADQCDAAEPAATAWLEHWDLRAEGFAALALTSEPPPKASAAQQQQQQQQEQQQRQQDQQPQQQEHADGAGPVATQAQDLGQQDAQQNAGQPQQVAAQQQQQQHGHMQGSAAAVAADLERLRGVMLQHAGALQMLFLLYASDSSGPVDAAARMGLQQFKSMLQAAKVTSSSVPPEKVDELYTMLQTSPGALSRKGQTQFSTGGIDFADFLILLVHVAHHRFASESFLTGASSTQLSTKLLSLLQDSICTHLFPELTKRLERLKYAVTPAARTLLKKGRRLTEQVLERCQIRRVRTKGTLQVPFAYVLKHLERWGLLGKDFLLQDLAPVVMFAKQETTDPYRFALHTQPLALDYDEFEKMLVGIAILQARLRKRSEVDEQLGELLDLVYRRSGVLVGMPAVS